MIGDDPTYPEVAGQGFSNLSGRIDQFAWDDVAKRMFVAVGNGGIWMSTPPAGDVTQIGLLHRDLRRTRGAFHFGTRSHAARPVF